MKKFLVYGFATFILLAATIAIVANIMLPPKIKEIIEKEGSLALGSPLTVGQVAIVFWPPLKLSLLNVNTMLTEPINAKVTIPQILIQADLAEIISGKLVAQVTVTQPQINMQLPEKPIAGTAPQTKEAKQTESTDVKTEKSTSPVAISIKLKAIDGLIDVVQGAQSVKLEKTNLEFEAIELDKPWSLQLDTLLDLNWASVKTSLPLKIKSNFTFIEDIFITKNATLDIGGLVLSLSGNTNLKTEDHVWDASTNIPDIKSLPVPPAFLPAGEWSGALAAKVHAEHKKSQDWSAQGSIKAQNLKGHINYDKEDKTIKGPVGANADVEFVFKKTLILNKIIADAEMKGLSLRIGKQFSKPVGVPFNFSITASQTADLINIQNAQARLAELKVAVTGSLASTAGKQSNLNITVPRTTLVGFEQFIPMLAGTPLQGFIEVKASLNGDLQKPENLNLNINPLLLQGVRGKFQWMSADKTQTLSGPMSIDAKAVIVTKGKTLSAASINTQADFSALDISMADKFQKKAGSPLKLNLSAQQKKSQVIISPSQLTTSAGVLKISGSFTEPQAPTFNVKMQIPKLDLNQISKLIPFLAVWKLSGAADADINLWGKYDFALGIQKSPLNLKGKISADMPQFIYKTAVNSTGSTKNTSAENSPATENKGKSEVNKSAAEPLLPNWPIMKNMNLETSLKLGHVEAMGLSINRVTWSGRLNQGVLTGTANIGEIFDGSAKAEKIETNLLEATPTTSLLTTVTNMNISKALSWATPEYKELASGKATGSLNIKAAHPSRPDFLDATWVKGSWRVTEGYMSTLQFDKYINQKLAGIPGLRDKANLNSGGLKSNIDTTFEFSKSQLNITTFNAITPERNELRASGWIRATDKIMDLRGTAYVSTPPVTGDILAANSDESGRLVLPVHFSGNVASPELHLAEETVKTLITRAATHAAGKFKKQAESTMRNEAQKHIDEQKKKLQEEAKKRLEGLF